MNDSSPRNALDASASIAALLRPRSIAIAGASSDRGKLGSLPLAFLRAHRYPGRIYPINPGAASIEGIACYPRMADVDDEVDLLVVAVGAARIPALFDECRDGQVKSAIILSSGFGETGPEGAKLQQDLRAQALAKGIRFIGPNSVGLANLHARVMPSISQVFDNADLQPGPVALVTQSGAVGTAIAALSHAEHLGIGYFVSTGNEGDLEFADFCEYFAADPSVSMIAGYLESVRDGAKFMRAVRRATAAGKPVVLLKVGTTEVGGRAVASHTGALAGAEDVYQCAFREAGVARASSIEELVDDLKIFAAFRREAYPAERRRARVVVLTHSGGAGVLTADACIAQGLELPSPSPSLRAALAQRLPPYASLHNPIDMTANVIFDPALMASLLRDVADSGEYDAAILCVNLIWRQGGALAEALIKAFDGSERNVALAWIAGRPEPIEQLARAGIPVFTDPVRCANAIGKRFAWAAARGAVIEDASPPASATASASFATHAEREALFRDYAIPLARGVLVNDAAAALRAAQSLGYPVAAKLVAHDLVHKSEAGGVALNIADAATLERRFSALAAIPVASREGILVQPMVGGSCELFAGMKRDDVFGPVIVFGLGGIYVEILRQTVMRLAPFTPAEATASLRDAAFYPILSGARGQAGVDVAALAALLSNLSRLAADHPSIRGIDCNPIVMTPEGPVVVDAKVLL